MTDPERQKESGVVSLDADTLRYVVHDELLWELLLDSVRVIGEFTTDAGPWFDDCFLVLVVGHPPRFFEVPVEAASSTALLKPLSVRLGSSIAYGLANRTDFVSRVMWPPHLTGHDLFEFQPEPRSGGLWTRAKDAVLPMISHSLTAEITAYVEQEAEQEAALDAHEDARQ